MKAGWVIHAIWNYKVVAKIIWKNKMSIYEKVHSLWNQFLAICVEWSSESAKFASMVFWGKRALFYVKSNWIQSSSWIKDWISWIFSIFWIIWQYASRWSILSNVSLKRMMRLTGDLVCETDWNTWKRTVRIMVMTLQTSPCLQN